MIHEHPEFVSENKTHTFIPDFEMLTDHLISARQPDQVIVIKKSQIVDFTVSADHRVKIIKTKRDKYLYLARELNMLWNMKVTLTLIATGLFGTMTKGLVK